MRGPWSRPSRAPLLFGLITLSACRYSTPVPPSPGGDPGRQDKNRIIDYAQKLPYRTRLGAAARQLLPEEKVIVQIEPQLASFKLSRGELDEGRVVARFHKARGGSVRRFGLGEADTVSYWLVYRKGDQYYGRFVSQSVDTTYRIEVTHHSEPDAGLEHNLPWAQAIAQFQYREEGFEEHEGRDKRRGDMTPMRDLAVAGGTTGWVTCSPYDCCRTQ
jgi:hypothetical protein